MTDPSPTGRESLDAIGLRHGTDKASAGHNYLRHYERFLGHLRDRAFLLLEIGGLNGASLRMWNDFFPRATILCLDVDSRVKAFEGGRIRVEIGNAADPAFLDGIKAAYDAPEVVIDDGSHRWDHQRVAFETLFPHLAPGGLFIVEDLHTSYEPGFAGGDSQPFSEYLKDRLDYLHLRGERKRFHESFYPRHAVELSKLVDVATYVPRACLIQKRASRPAPAPAQPVADNEPPALPAGVYDGRADVTVAARRRGRELIVPSSIGVLTREAATRRTVSPDQTLAELKDVICLPRQVLIQDAEILPDSFRRRNPKHAHVQLQPAEDGRFRPRIDPEPREVIEEPCFYLDGEHADHFGHFTLEVLSRLWPLLTADPSPYLFLTSAKPAPRHAELLAPFGVRPEQIRYFTQPVHCRRLTVASQGYILEQSVSDGALGVWRRIGDHYDDGGRTERLYVSRTKWGKQRRLLNEDAVEAAAAARGFQVVRPETLTVPEQVRLFRGARTIAGPSGSGLYNAVYARDAGRRLILASSRFVTLNDALVNAATDSEVRYVTGDAVEPDKPGMLADWSIDLALVERALDAL